MTMATYSKKRLSRTSSRPTRNSKSAKAEADVATHSKPLPTRQDSASLTKVEDKPCVHHITSNSSRLCSESLSNNCYEVLEAVGLTRVDVRREVPVKEKEVVPAPNNQCDNDSEVENKCIAPQDRNNNNTNKTIAKTKLRRCTKCDLSFKSVLKYNQHRKQNHPRSKILYCKICSKTFRNSELLLKHKKCHSGDKPYCCLQCKKKFGALQSLMAHIRRHAGKLPYTCKVCKMGFDLYSDYSEHQPVHLLRKPERPKHKSFKCKSCTKEFRKLCDLERHTRVHTGEKPYSCKICKNRFQQAHNLTKHMIIHTKERQFKCEICAKQFGRSDVLTRHMITHSVNKPHPCDSCEKSFGRYSQLIDHLKKHHGLSE